ncbi:histidine kinase [Sphingomonas sp.]|uniref:sensor histidine kinase n=1 Tax=Sphingomonas sp. TaxID=28214 RepID=UPI0025D7A5A8|nr:histidine kinase [Sphingomonas sp.]MBV9527402.1 histidine kinase [Sphingomonas sp.]
MLMMPAVPRRTRFADWPLALKSILGFWLFYAATVVARAFLGSDPLTTVENKLLVIVVGIALTALIYLTIAGFGMGRSIRAKALIAVAASVIGSCLMAVMLISTEDHLRPSREQFRVQASEGMVVVAQDRTLKIERRAAEPLVLTLPKFGQLDANQRFRYAADVAVIWLFFFLAWSAFYIATQAQSVALGAQQRAAEAESAAQAAQLRALRYQVNPHFLFNTLNSLSSLIIANRGEEAESMVLKLSTFFRQSLTLDAGADISLAEEIALQRLYLDIERVRFPRRLKVEVDVPANLEKARLPALILQPLVENAIKHAVSPTRDTVILRIAAREAGPGRFAIEVENRGGRPLASKTVDVDGTGVGITNVRQRLSARFGSLATCAYGPTGDGGYRVELLLPLDLQD